MNLYIEKSILERLLFSKLSHKQELLNTLENELKKANRLFFSTHSLEVLLSDLKDRTKKHQILLDLQILFEKFLPLNEEDIILSIKLEEELGLTNCLDLAICLNHKMDYIITEDKDLKRQKLVKVKLVE
ncbi:MAG: hypothetical protein SFU98_19585 [Leptospiraceae bacterium]|nr:hypothetical protein [Leptospiraceae bacterium]